MIMKKIFYMAVSAVILAAGCQKTEIQNEALTPIGFNAVMGKLTKGTPDALTSTSDVNLKEQGFKVWAYFATAEDLNYNEGDLYLGTVVTEGEGASAVTRHEGVDVTFENNTWATSEMYYWPGKNKDLAIFAVSLWNNDFSYTNVVPSYNDKKVTVSDFVVTAGADNDLMVAAMIKQNQDTDTHIKPYFQHALTKVLLNFGTNQTDSDVYVVSAKIKSVKSTGDLVVTSTYDDAKGKYVADFTWTTGDATADYPAQYTNLTDFPFGGATVPAVKLSAVASEIITFGSWLFIPQTSLDNVKLEVDYIVEGTRTVQTFDLKVAGKVESWGRNIQTTYNMIISPDFITFEPDVEEWLEANQEGRDS